jgi:hypothetical protein
MALKTVMHPNLKLQLWKCGIRQNRLAQLMGIHETLWWFQEEAPASEVKQPQ